MITTASLVDVIIEKLTNGDTWYYFYVGHDIEARKRIQRNIRQALRRRGKNWRVSRSVLGDGIVVLVV